MKRLFLATLISFSTITFAQTPSVSALSFSLDNYGLYNNWHNQSDTFFVVPIRMDAFVSGVDSFAFNITYDDALLTPIMDLTAINHPGFILLMNYLGGAEFAMVDGVVIHTDTFDLMMGNTNKMLSISFKAQNAFTQGMYNNCGGTLMYVAFKRNNVCSGGTFNLNFIDGLIGTVYINPMQTNTFLLSGTQNYSVDNNTLVANNGQVSKQILEATGKSEAIRLVANAEAAALSTIGDAAITQSGKAAVTLTLAQDTIAAHQAIAAQSTVVLTDGKTGENIANTVAQAIAVSSSLKLPTNDAP